MKPTETNRFICGDCKLAFDIAIAPPSDWGELPQEGEADIDIEPTVCPVCGAGELRRRPDVAIAAIPADEEEPPASPNAVSAAQQLTDLADALAKQPKLKIRRR